MMIARALETCRIKNLKLMTRMAALLAVPTREFPHFPWFLSRMIGSSVVLFSSVS